MSTYTDILDEIRDLLEGSSGTVRTISSGTFKHFGDDDDFDLAYAIDAPYPFFISPIRDIEEEDVPSNVSGDYHYLGKEIIITFVYSGKPFDKFTLEKTIAGHEKTIRKALNHPNNWANVDDWCGCELEFSRQSIGDEDGLTIAETLGLTLQLSFREDLST